MNFSSNNNEIVELMMKHCSTKTNGKTSKDDVMKLLIPSDIQNEMHKARKFKKDLVLDVVKYNDKTYYKDSNDNLLNDKIELVGFIKHINKEPKLHFYNDDLTIADTKHFNLK